MPESILYTVVHAQHKDTGDTINISGDNIHEPSLIVTVGGEPAYTYTPSKALFDAFNLGYVFVTPDPTMYGKDGVLNSPIGGIRSIPKVLEDGDTYYLTGKEGGYIIEVKGHATVWLPGPEDTNIISNEKGRFYLSFAVRSGGYLAVRANGTTSILEASNHIIQEMNAATVILHEQGAVDISPNVWGLYGALSGEIG